MSDQFKRQKITREIARIKDTAIEANRELDELRANFKRLFIECELLKQQRDDLKRFAYEEAPRIAAEEANKQIDPLKAEIERLRNELHIIANGETKSFEIWAKNRARHALGRKPGELTIKRG